MGIKYAHSQERNTEIFVDFRVNSTHIDTLYRNNTERISELISFLRQIQADKTISIVNVSFCGAASPEGSYEWNRHLANGRLKALEKVVRSKIEIPDSIITYDDSYIPWQYLVEQISASEIPHKQEILSIIDGKAEIVAYHSGRSIDSRILKLQKLDGGKVWRELHRHYFSPMRNACVVFVTFKKEESPKLLPVPTVEKTVPASAVDTTTVTPELSDTVLTVSPNPNVEQWKPRLSVKSNALGLGLAIANAAVEIDICKHLSFSLPVYYSAWNYFTPTVKFRTFAVQPEMRYWFSEINDGWFAGAHIGLAYYNIATDGQYRTQDHDGKSPALGGGLAAGYRLPISRDGRWKMEFSIGAGAYALHYDKYHNRRNGPLVSTKKKAYIGIDQASVSFSYTFGQKKKGGVR